MKKFVIAILALFSMNACHAENVSITEIRAYEGSIAGNDVFMTLSETNGAIVGGYFYQKYGKTIPLQGSIKNNHIKLTEKTASSEALLTADINMQLLQGTWRSDRTSHSFDALALSKSYKDIISRIDVSDRDEKKNITITFTDNKSQTFEAEISTDIVSIVFEDYNFDGFPDLKLLENSAGPNATYIAWTYNPSKKKFEHSKKISSLTNPKVLHSEKAILSLSRDGCCRYIASKSIGKENYFAEFNYDKSKGIERVTDTKTKKTKTRSISQNHFERKYLTPMGADGL